MHESILCSVCGAALTEDNAHEFDEQILCDRCLIEETLICDCCGDRIWRENSEGDSNTTLCSHCYDYNYTTCEDCGRLIHNDDAHYDEDSDYAYCDSCFYKRESSIHPYGYKPEPLFYGSGDLFMGVELEIDGAGEYSENAKKLLDIANHTEERIYCKHDGSLNEGFEIVSHPMSLDYHSHEMNWNEVFTAAVNMDYASHNTSSCGLHVHCSRSAFGEEKETQEAVIGRIVFFVEKHWNELVKFSRRKMQNLNRWAARYETISNTTQETYKKAKDKNMGRYVAVNLTNYATIEFRLFRGTLRYKTFIATLQLVEQICLLAKMLNDREMESLSWSDFVLNIDSEHYPELIDYLKSRRLYVNDIIEESEEL